LKGVLICAPSYLDRHLDKLRYFYYTERAKIQVSEYKEGLSVNNCSNFIPKTFLGENNNFNGMNVNGKGKLVIGDNFHSGKDCLIITQNHNYKGDAVPYDDTYIRETVEIEDNVWLGSRVTILPGVTIEEGAIIQAGSVVTSDVPECSIAGGHPTKVFRERETESIMRT
jgi:acetyltransferase-like isoleucine patch superfamily enzyme